MTHALWYDGQASYQNGHVIQLGLPGTESKEERWLREWIAQDAPPVREFSKIQEVDYIDLPTGHWPQFTRPEELARQILAAMPTPWRGE